MEENIWVDLENLLKIIDPIHKRIVIDTRFFRGYVNYTLPEEKLELTSPPPECLISFSEIPDFICRFKELTDKKAINIIKTNNCYADSLLSTSVSWLKYIIFTKHNNEYFYVSNHYKRLLNWRNCLIKENIII